LPYRRSLLVDKIKEIGLCRQPGILLTRNRHSFNRSERIAKQLCRQRWFFAERKAGGRAK
jgi:hypothetical protein